MFTLNKNSIPQLPGCYLMKDANGNVIYIGKAKNLRKRVTSYRYSKDSKTKSLVSEINDIEYIVTDNQVEALILEAQLIHHNHPKYNIDLKAGLRYAFIKITNEKFPRLLLARKIAKDGNYFGPYPSGESRTWLAKSAINLFKLRTCKKIPSKACLRYHLDYCSAPCIKQIEEAEYNQAIKDAERFLKGDYNILINKIRKLMYECAEKEKFEKAKIYRDQLFALEKLEEQKLSTPKEYDQDIINFIILDNEIIFQLFQFHKGIISGRKEYSFDLQKIILGDDVYPVINDKAIQALQDFIHQYYSSFNIPREIILPEVLPKQQITIDYLTKISGHKVELTVPIKGLKFKLLYMVKKNLILKAETQGSQLHELGQILRLPIFPNVIACIDVSTLAGTNSVGSLVQFVNGHPYKNGYRRFQIKGVDGIDDYAMLSEIVLRFGKRIKKGLENKPDLLIVDGGRGQLNTINETLNKLDLDIQTISLAKKFEEIYTNWADTPLRLPNNNRILHLLQFIRDEAHRFAIKYQRKKRTFKYELS